MDYQAEETARMPRWAWWLHLWFIGNMAAQILYIAWQVFVVLQPEGVIGPAFGAAITMPPEIFAARRAYAVEGWIAFVGLALYVGLTEIVPRRLGRPARW